jgi:hypothetical protein
VALRELEGRLVVVDERFDEAARDGRRQQRVAARNGADRGVAGP